MRALGFAGGHSLLPGCDERAQGRVEDHTAFVEATKLKRGRRILSQRLAAPIEKLPQTAAAAGDAIAAELNRSPARPPLDVQVTIDRRRRVRFDPRTTWAAYYAFPEAAPDARWLARLHRMQHSWRLTSHVDQIPKKPFIHGHDIKSTYLEVRHDGYRPEFVPLKDASPRAFTICLSPVRHKRIALLDFPCANADRGVANLSQLIAQEIVGAIERRSELATFAYFSDGAGNAGTGDSSDETSTEVLTRRDVEAVQLDLEAIDTDLVSGEGRHLLRKALDIQFLVRGSYRPFNEGEA
jgi:hypothetical protein